MRKKIGWSRWFLAMGAGLLAAFFLGAAHLVPWPEWAQASRGWFEHHPVSGAALYFLGFAVGVSFLFPGMLLGAGAGFLFGFWRGWAMASLAPLAAAAAVFLFSRYLSERWMPVRWREDVRYRLMDQIIREKGPWIIGWLRLSPLIPFGIANALYGMTSVRFHLYLGASWLGLLPGAALAAWLGHAGGGMAFGPREATLPEKAVFFLGLAVTLGMTLYLSRWIRKYLREAAPSLRVAD